MVPYITHQLKKNEKKIKELLAKINAITPQIHEVETNIANATMQFELDLYNYKYWVVTVTKVLENIERSRKNESTEWVHQMEQRITERVNSRFWKIYEIVAAWRIASNTTKIISPAMKKIGHIIHKTKIGRGFKKLEMIVRGVRT